MLSLATYEDADCLYDGNRDAHGAAIDGFYVLADVGDVRAVCERLEKLEKVLAWATSTRANISINRLMTEAVGIEVWKNNDSVVYPSLESAYDAEHAS